MPQTEPPPLLNPQFLHRLEQLELVSRKIFLGRMKGERRSKRKGQSVEFADYRNYVMGDDLRFLDWNLFGHSTSSSSASSWKRKTCTFTSSSTTACRWT